MSLFSSVFKMRTSVLNLSVKLEKHMALIWLHKYAHVQRNETLKKSFSDNRYQIYNHIWKWPRSDVKKNLSHVGKNWWEPRQSMWK